MHVTCCNTRVMCACCIFIRAACSVCSMCTHMILEHTRPDIHRGTTTNTQAHEDRHNIQDTSLRQPRNLNPSPPLPRKACLTHTQTHTPRNINAPGVLLPEGTLEIIFPTLLSLKRGDIFERGKPALLERLCVGFFGFLNDSTRSSNPPLSVALGTEGASFGRGTMLTVPERTSRTKASHSAGADKRRESEGHEHLD